MWRQRGLVLLHELKQFLIAMLGNADGNAYRISTFLLTIIINAIYAMENVASCKGVCVVVGLDSVSKFNILSVSNTRSGQSETVCRQLPRPYLTIKRHICYAVTTAHAVAYFCRKWSEGATFCICLPKRFERGSYGRICK